MFELIKKDIPLSEMELEGARNAAKSNPIFNLPQPIMEFVIKLMIKNFRAQALKTVLPKVEIKHKIIRNEIKLDAGSGEFSVFIYRREGMESAGNPLFYFIHGGGFLGGTYLANDSLMRKLCDESDIACASVEYHTAPEVRFPNALYECKVALQKAIEFTKSYIDETKVFISGDSAGGNLAATLCLLLKNEQLLTPRGQILLYPVTNMQSLDTPSYLLPGWEYEGMRKGIYLSRKLYARTKKDYDDIYFSPFLSTPKDDPNPTPALLLLAKRDGLLDDGIAYAKHLAALGGDARCVVYQNSFHAFMNGLGDSPSALDAYAEMRCMCMSIDRVDAGKFCK